MTNFRRIVRAGRGSRRPQTAYVAMFDVLGFGRIVEQNPLATLADIYKRLQHEKLDAAEIPVFSLSKTKHWVTPTTIFSDTILMWSDASFEALDTLLATASLLLARSLEFGWPLRGGIAFGECILDRQRRIFLGQPIVDAHKTEASQEWIGAALHDSCFHDPQIAAKLQRHDCIRRYEVPVKSCAQDLQWAIHWCDRIRFQNPIEHIHRLASNIPVGPVKTKYVNTETYIKMFCSC